MFLPIASVALSSCEQLKSYKEHLDDYVFNMEYRDHFNILQLSDIHWSNNTSTVNSKEYLSNLLKTANEHVDKIDLLEITGDLFMLYNSYHLDNFINFFEQQANLYGFKYAVIWGNHDHHGLVNPNTLSSRFIKAPHCIHIDPNDDLYGRSNFVINLTEDGTKDSKTIWQLANFDSGASFSETAISIKRDYDYIRDDQVDWWLLEHDKVGKDVPTVAYYHIPQQDNEIAYQEVIKGIPHKNKFFKLEDFAANINPYYESKLIKVGSENNLKAAFMGHAHSVDWTVEYMGVTIGLCVKTGQELYFAHIEADTTDVDMRRGLETTGINEDFDLIGASLVSLDDELGNFTLEHLYYNQRANGDFIRWVSWND